MRAGRVGVVVLDRARPDDAAEAARSALDAELLPRIVVVENGAGPEPSLPVGTELLRLPQNRGYAGGMNAGIDHLRRAGCDRFLLMNNDAVLDPGCLRRLAEALSDLAAVAPVILRREDGRIESRGGRLDLRWGRYRLWGHGDPAAAQEGLVEAEVLSGAVWMIGRDAYERVGLLDESFFFSFEDVDWCLRARRIGLRLGVVLGAVARHWGSRSIGPGSPERLYYAARNHLHAAERHLPLGGAARWLRRASIVSLNLGHALVQDQVPRLAGLRAVLRGTLDFCQGRLGPLGVP